MNKVIKYVLFTFLISWSLWALKILAQEEIIPSFLEFLGELAVFGPLFAVLLVVDKPKTYLKELFHGNTPKWIYYAVIIVPVLLSFGSYLIMTLYKDMPFELGLSLPMIPLVGLIILLVGGPVEEFGWRGLLQREFRLKYGFVMVSLVIGLIHGLWHIPLFYIAGTVQENMPIYEFILITVLGAFMYSYVYEKTRNILPMILLHWMNNFSSAVFMYWTNTFGRYMLFYLTVIVDIVIIVVLYREKKLT